MDPSSSLPQGAVVAAVDVSTAALPVLQTARHLAVRLGRPVRAVHVEERGEAPQFLQELVAQAGIDLVVLQGEPLPMLASFATAREVAVLVVGARALPAARHAMGHLSAGMLSSVTTAAVFVPPDDRSRDRPITRVLTPLDDDPRCGAAVEPFVRDLRAAGSEVIGLHVFETRTVPSFLDHPGHGTASWRDEFARRHGIAEMELRRGPPARMILETARERDVDLVLLAWSRVLDDVHGAVIYEVLAGAEVPVMVIPADVAAPAGVRG